ncbi:MAG TPA: AraC family transcriptional regulator [Candidatus Limosilactobacillus merdigallinarum]|uniref:AraC family transcriptional regulator n=1 Tax=Candidatus Limosilactobacillus merdigallinarum TaxID=2838652 RepID=A0A9D1VI23_9LACO|nr:AraC family transcriptional regulator [Candidatus Limosilactobacillus merdigallinarum]
MNKEELYRNAIDLPVFDWQVSLFGAYSQKVNDDWSCPIDSHQAFETIAILNGQEIVTVEGKSHLLNQGDMIIIKPGQLHAAKAIHQLKYFNFHFVLDSPLFNLNLTNSRHFIFRKNSKISTAAWPLFQELMQLNRHPHLFTSQLQAQIILSKFLSLLSHLTTVKAQPTPANQLAVSLYQSIKDIFNERLYHSDQSDLSSGTIIEKALAVNNISHSYANRLFRDAFGISPRHLLSTLMQEAAKQLLALPDNTTTSVAQRLGYTNPANFSRQFKKWTGISPSEYQENIH